ncbi:MAG: PepSY domain-containing protein [Chloroflexota bacterium]
MFDINRLRGPVLAAIAALLIGGASIALATNHETPASPPQTEADEPGGPDTDTLEEGEQDGLDDEDQEDEAAEAEALAGLATVSEADARAAALSAVPGEVVQTELDNENGFLVWSVEVRDAAGAVTDVKIDAGNGAVLGTEADDDGAEEGVED